MFEPDSQRDRIIQATLALAAEQDWHSITMTGIAARAETTLAETRMHFATRADILKAFSAAVDKAVLKQMAGDGEEGGLARDRLFDTLMTRFEILEPYKSALRRLNQVALRNPVQSVAMGFDLALTMLNAQRWMLEAAGIPASGAAGRTRLLGISAIFARVVQTWLDDDDAGLARTMAALDSRLRRGEKIIRRVDDACSLVSGLANVILSRRAPRSKPSTGSVAPANGSEPA